MICACLVPARMATGLTVSLSSGVCTGSGSALGFALRTLATALAKCGFNPCTTLGHRQDAGIQRGRGFATRRDPRQLRGQLAFFLVQPVIASHRHSSNLARSLSIA